MEQKEKSTAGGQLVIDTVTGHPVFRHVFWQRLREASRTVSFETLVAIFHQWDRTTGASRSIGSLPAVLASQGLKAQGTFITQILTSEGGHQEELWRMMSYLLSTAFPEESAWHGIDPRKTAQLGERLQHITMESFLEEHINQGDAVLPGTRRTVELFALRQNEGREDALYSLGVMAAVEFFANRSFMPGNVQAFIGNKRFGSPSLELPQMHYLLEHVGDAGAEAQHEEAMTQALLDGVLKEKTTTVEVIAAGAQAWCDAAHHWYDDMLSLLPSQV